MPILTPDEWKKAHKRARNAKGHFVSNNADPKAVSDATFEAKGPINIITKRPEDSLDEPLISFSIQNPFKKILHWLNDIRKKQTTTFDFKIKIPLLALPIFLAVLGGAFQFFFNLGQAVEKKEVAAQPTPTPIVITKPPAPVIVSRIGIVKATYQIKDTTEDNDHTATSSADISPTPTAIPYRYVLDGKYDQITFLILPQGLSLNRYLNKRVLATGLYDEKAKTMKITRLEDIEVLP